MDPQKARYLRKQKRIRSDVADMDDDWDMDDEFEKDAKRALLRTEEGGDDKEEKMIAKRKENLNFFGSTLEPFSMKREMETGDVGRDGFYVYNKQEMEERRDPWLDQLDEGEYEQNMNFDKIAAQKAKFEKENEEKPEVGGYSPADLLQFRKSIYDLLNTGESVRELIDRVRPPKKEFQPFKKNVRKKQQKEPAGGNEEGKESQMQQDSDAVRVEAQAKFDDLIRMVTAVTEHGDESIYKRKKEDLGDIIKMVEYKLAMHAAPHRNTAAQPIATMKDPTESCKKSEETGGEQEIQKEKQDLKEEDSDEEESKEEEKADSEGDPVL